MPDRFPPKGRRHPPQAPVNSFRTNRWQYPTILAGCRRQFGANLAQGFWIRSFRISFCSLRFPFRSLRFPFRSLRFSLLSTCRVLLASPLSLLSSPRSLVSSLRFLVSSPRFPPLSWLLAPSSSHLAQFASLPLCSHRLSFGLFRFSFWSHPISSCSDRLSRFLVIEDHDRHLFVDFWLGRRRSACLNRIRTVTLGSVPRNPQPSALSRT